MTNEEFDRLVRECTAKVQAEVMRLNWGTGAVTGAEMLCDEILAKLRGAP